MKGAIFDLDGTLLDSMWWWEASGSNYVKALGLTPLSDLDERIKTLSLVQAAELLREEAGVPHSVEEVLDHIYREAVGFYTKEASLKKGALSLLNQLRHQGVVLSIATAAHRQLAEAALKRNGIIDLFEGIVTCTELGVGKDQPDSYERALQMMGTPREQTFVFEDALHAIETAKKAGFPVVGVYDAYSHQEQEKIRQLSDVYITMEEERIFEQYFKKKQ